MSADDMFEKLGYTKYEDSDHINYGIVKYDWDKFPNFKFIDFEIINHTFACYDGNFDYTFITFEELQAINKKVEELGWKKSK